MAVYSGEQRVFSVESVELNYKTWNAHDNLIAEHVC